MFRVRGFIFKKTVVRVYTGVVCCSVCTCWNYNTSKMLL